MNTARLLQAMERTGMTGRALAKKSGIHHNTIYAYTSGKTDPSCGNAKRIARVLGVSLDWLCG